MNARSIVARGAVLSLALTAGACAARAPLAVPSDDAAGAATEVGPRVPGCQPGIRETSCTPGADAGEPSQLDAGADGTPPALDAAAQPPPALDAGADSIPEAGSPPDGSVDGAVTCQPTAGGMWGPRLVDVQPTRVTSHTTVTFTLTFDGELPSPLTLWVQMGSAVYHVNPASVAADASSLKIAFPISPPAGPREVSLLQGTDPRHLLVLAWMDCAVQVETLPPKPVFVPPPPGPLGAPLHPELARPCARWGTFDLTSGGDGLVVQSVTTTGSPSFTVANDACTGKTLPYDLDDGYDQGCTVEVCFSSTTPGTEGARLTIHTSAGDVGADVSNDVLPWTEGLDRGFAGTGALVTGSGGSVSPILAVTPLNNGISLALLGGGHFGITFVSADGDVWAPTQPIMLNGGFVYYGIYAVHAGAPGQGLYALTVASVGEEMFHFFDDGTRDMQFAGTGSVRLDDWAQPYGGIEVLPSGRVVAIGKTTSAFAGGVRAFSPDGDEVLGSPNQIQNIGIDAVDARGRMYLATGAGVVRLDVDGAVDPTFSFTGPVEAIALDADQHLLVGAAGALERLDDGGAASAVPLERQPELVAPMVDLDVDAKGRILIAPASGSVCRFLGDGSFDARVGLPDGGIKAVVCPRQGPCSIAGALRWATIDPFEEDYLLRLAPD